MHLIKKILFYFKKVLTDRMSDDEPHGQELRHLVFLGAGAMYPAHVGVLHELVQRQVLRRLRTAVGVSIGSLLLSLLLASMHRPREKLMRKMVELATTTHSRHMVLDPIGTDATASILEYGSGLYYAKNIIEFTRNEMKASDLGNADATLREVRQYSGVDLKILVCQTANYHMLKSDVANVVLDADTFPNMPVWMAVRASCSVYPVVSPVRVRGVDGWWLDPALFKHNAAWARSLVEDLPGQHLVVSLYGRKVMSMSRSLNMWNGGSFEKYFVWLLSTMVVDREPVEELVHDAHALQFQVDSFALNLGFNQASSTRQFNRGRRMCAKHLARREKLRPVPRPDTYTVPRVASPS